MNQYNCIGCGGTLQNTHPQAPFYTPKEIDSETRVLCQRCFRLRHYGQVEPSALDTDHYRTMIDTLFDKDALMVLVVDVFDLAGSLVPSLRRLLLEKDVLVLVNKCDLMPRSVPIGKLAHRVMRQLHLEGIKPLKVLPVSALRKVHIDEALDTMFEMSKQRDVYVLGATNVGKSTLINAFIAASTGQPDQPLSVHGSRGTTQGFVALPFGEALLYDTPGLYPSNHIADFISERSYAQLQPKKEIKPQGYQLDPGQTLFISGLCRLDYVRGHAARFIVYVADTIVVHRRKTVDAEAFCTRHQGTLLNPPDATESPMTLKAHRFTLNASEKVDLVVPGIGFVSVIGVAVLEVHTIEAIRPYKREALI